MSDVELCGAEGCEKHAKKAGLCWGHYEQKNQPGGFRPLKVQHAPRGEEKYSSLELLLAQARAVSNADEDDAYLSAVRNLVFAARMRTLRPLTGLLVPRVVSKRVRPDGVVVIEFREEPQRAAKASRPRRRRR